MLAAPVLWAALVAALCMPACGGGGSSSSAPPPNPGTPTGTYNLTVTATINSGGATLSHTLGFTLTVN